MKIYAAVLEIDYEGIYSFDLYLSKEKAEKAVEKLRKENPSDEVRLEEREVT